MGNEGLLHKYLHRRLGRFVEDEDKRKKVVGEVVDIAGHIEVEGKSLKELVEDPEDVAMSFRTVYPLVYAVVYKNDKELYSLLAPQEPSCLLSTFELMAWLGLYDHDTPLDSHLDRFLRLGLAELPLPLAEFLEKTVRQPGFRGELGNAWLAIRKEYRNRVRKSILDDIGTHLNVLEKDVVEAIMQEVSKLLSGERFPPPPYGTIHHDLHWGSPVQLDRTVFFIEYLNRSKTLGWVFPELVDLWFEIFRRGLIGNQFSLEGLKEIIRKFLVAQGDLKERFRASVNEWAQKREREYQYPVHLIARCLTMLFQENRISIDELRDFELLEGTTAWNTQMIALVDSDEIKSAVCVFKYDLHDANSRYFDYFFWKNDKEITALAHDFHTYQVRPGEPDQWRNLIRCWIAQFEENCLVDVALDILRNVLYVSTQEVCHEFDDWVRRMELLQEFKEGKALIVYEPGSSVTSVLQRLRGKYFLKELQLTEHAFQCASLLHLAPEDLVPTDSELIAYLQKDHHKLKYFKKGESRWRHIIYVEDNIGTGSQASEKMGALLKYLEKAGLDRQRVNVKYWVHVVADAQGLGETLRNEGIDPSMVESKIDLKESADIGNKLVQIDKLLQERYSTERDELKSKLESICGSTLSNAPVGWASDRRHWLGYGGLGLIVVFEHGTPNTTLPILWRDCTEPRKFFALFPRRKSAEQNIVWDDVDSILHCFNYGDKETAAGRD